jgi:hypothetical protein
MRLIVHLRRRDRGEELGPEERSDDMASVTTPETYEGGSGESGGFKRKERFTSTGLKTQAIDG